MLARSLPLTFALVLVASAAGAADCPPGSVHKEDQGFGWCEPTVCLNDRQCTTNEVCRPVALCMQVGTTGDGGEGGAQRLSVTQRCAPDKTCPQATVCSDLSRCVSKADAERMGLLAPAPAPAPAETKKSACGCEVVGAPTSGGASIAFALALTIGLALNGRRARGRSHGSRR